MRFCGIDLAWGLRAWTGLAVLDESGRLLHLSRCRTDEEIVATLAPYVEGPVVAGIDAPVVVRNTTGRRLCETQVTAVFGRFHAGAHSSNLSMPVFAWGPRGGRVAELLGLDVDPCFAPRTAVRRALEVYPHPATITLFGLDRVLPYKAKPGRTADSRRTALLALLDGLEGLAAADPPLRLDGCAAWASARAAVAGATTGAALEREEDAVDAVLCAYIALHRWTHGDARSALLGDPEAGCIVVPLDERVRPGVTALSAGVRRKD